MGLTLAELVAAGGGTLDGLKVSAPTSVVDSADEGVNFVYWLLDALWIASNGEATDPQMITKRISTSGGVMRVSYDVRFSSTLSGNADWLAPKPIVQADDNFA